MMAAVTGVRGAPTGGEEVEEQADVPGRVRQAVARFKASSTKAVLSITVAPHQARKTDVCAANGVSEIAGGVSATTAFARTGFPAVERRTTRE